jgi:hypothetical protein
MEFKIETGGEFACLGRSQCKTTATYVITGRKTIDPLCHSSIKTKSDSQPFNAKIAHISSQY